MVKKHGLDADNRGGGGWRRLYIRGRSCLNKAAII